MGDSLAAPPGGIRRLTSLGRLAIHRDSQFCKTLNHDHLQDLSLAGNNLKVLPEGIGRLTSLERLALAGNCLETLPDSICQLTSLKVQQQQRSMF